MLRTCSQMSVLIARAFVKKSCQNIRASMFLWSKQGTTGRSHTCLFHIFWTTACTVIMTDCIKVTRKAGPLHSFLWGGRRHMQPAKGLQFPRKSLLPRCSQCSLLTDIFATTFRSASVYLAVGSNVALTAC